MFGILIPQRKVITEFKQLSETSLQAHITDFYQAKYITVFAISPPPLPEGAGYSIYIQASSDDPVYLGQLNSKNYSVSKAIYFLHKQEESTGRVFIVIEPMRLEQLPEDNSMKLLQIGVGLANDFEKFVSSFDDIYYEGDHYVNARAVDAWAASLPQRIYVNQRFWDGIE